MRERCTPSRSHGAVAHRCLLGRQGRVSWQPVPQPPQCNTTTRNGVTDTATAAVWWGTSAGVCPSWHVLPCSTSVQHLSQPPPAAPGQRWSRCHGSHRTPHSHRGLVHRPLAGHHSKMLCHPPAPHRCAPAAGRTCNKTKRRTAQDAERAVHALRLVWHAKKETAQHSQQGAASCLSSVAHRCLPACNKTAAGAIDLHNGCMGCTPCDFTLLKTSTSTAAYTLWRPHPPEVACQAVAHPVHSIQQGIHLLLGRALGGGGVGVQGQPSHKALHIW
jgi:hypothetical protein